MSKPSESIWELTIFLSNSKRKVYWNLTLIFLFELNIFVDLINSKLLRKFVKFVSFFLCQLINQSLKVWFLSIYMYSTWKQRQSIMIKTTSKLRRTSSSTMNDSSESLDRVVLVDTEHQKSHEPRFRRTRIIKVNSCSSRLLYFSRSNTSNYWMAWT